MRILVVDDEQAVRESLERSLRFEGYDVELAADGVEALRLLGERQVDAVVLDVLMPRMDGLETCRRLRASGRSLPVLMLTARDGVADRVTGLDVGADDYLVKPFALEELLARLRALLRRAAMATAADGDGHARSGALQFEDLRLDPVTREVHRGDRPIELTRMEFELLELFMRHPRQVLPRGVILERVWGYAFATTSNSLEVFVGFLRRKTEAGGEPRLLHTVRGVGYVLRSPSP
jgi:two-component system, OmpR family, response regulator MprA